MAIFKLNGYRFQGNEWVQYNLVLSDPNKNQKESDPDADGVIVYSGTSTFYYQKIDTGREPKYIWVRARFLPSSHWLEWSGTNLEGNLSVWVPYPDTPPVDVDLIQEKLQAAALVPIHKPTEEKKHTNLDLETQKAIKDAGAQLASAQKYRDVLSDEEYQTKVQDFIIEIFQGIEQTQSMAEALKPSLIQFFNTPEAVSRLLGSMILTHERAGVLVKLWNPSLQNAYQDSLVTPDKSGHYSDLPLYDTLRLLEEGNRSDFITVLGLENLAKMINYSADSRGQNHRIYYYLNDTEKTNLIAICLSAEDKQRKHRAFIEALKQDKSKTYPITSFERTDPYCQLITIIHGKALAETQWYSDYIEKSQVKKLSPDTIIYQMYSLHIERIDPLPILEFFGEPLKKQLRNYRNGRLERFFSDLAEEKTSRTIDFMLSIYTPSDEIWKMSAHLHRLELLEIKHKLKFLKKFREYLTEDIGQSLFGFIQQIFENDLFQAVNAVGSETFIKFVHSKRHYANNDTKPLLRACVYFSQPGRYYRPPDQPLNQFISEFFEQVVGTQKYLRGIFFAAGETIALEVIHDCKSGKSNKILKALCEAKLKQIDWENESEQGASFFTRSKPTSDGEIAMRLMFCLELLNNEINTRPVQVSFPSKLSIVQ